MTLADFPRVYAVDFEFSAKPGERPAPVCLVAKEFRTGDTIRLWEDDLRRRTEAPYPTDSDTLFVAYYASAEVGCHEVLGWALPARVLDLFAEFRTVTNGYRLPCGGGLVGALASFGLSGIDATEKDSMRALAIRGGPWTTDERRALLDYCEQDVVALTRLLPKMLPSIDFERALLRGRFMVAAARIEAVGVPIDTLAHAQLTARWGQIQDCLIERIDVDYGVYEGRTFKTSKFGDFLVANDMPWPRLPSGTLALDDDTFREMARSYPRVGPLGELRRSLAGLRLADLAVGQDGRNRCLLSAFRARTGRNQPSNSQFIFGPAAWLRGLIRPEPGRGLAYLDWSQQEFGIAAALSGDPDMMAAYTSGDPYLAFAKQAGAVPPSATRDTHPTIREQFKACALAVQYGMGPESLGLRIGQSTAQARELLRLHHQSYHTFWQWSDASLDYAYLHGSLSTTFGWTVHVAPRVNPRSLRNFPMQANGAEMMRLACCFATERGIRVCAPVHDALLIEAPLGALECAVATTLTAMERASCVVLAGFSLRADASLVRFPDRYADARGQRMWDTVWDILAELDGGQGATGALVADTPVTTRSFLSS